MTTVERVRDICKQKRIPISRLEKDLGFGNGFLNPKKITDIPVERLVKIAEYFNMSIEEILGKKITPTDNGEREEVIAIMDGELNEQGVHLLAEFAKTLAKTLRSPDVH